MVASDKNSRLTYKEFKETVQDLDEAEVNVTPSSFILGRNLTESDLDSPDVVRLHFVIRMSSMTTENFSLLTLSPLYTSSFMGAQSKFRGYQQYEKF